MDRMGELPRLDYSELSTPYLVTPNTSRNITSYPRYSNQVTPLQPSDPFPASPILYLPNYPGELFPNHSIIAPSHHPSKHGLIPATPITNDPRNLSGSLGGHAWRDVGLVYVPTPRKHPFPPGGFTGSSQRWRCVLRGGGEPDMCVYDAAGNFLIYSDHELVEKGGGTRGRKERVGVEEVPISMDDLLDKVMGVDQKVPHPESLTKLKAVGSCLVLFST